jgi:mannose-6-phosphate isomerase
MVWGDRRLGEVLGKSLPSESTFGESWEVSDHPSHRTIVATGELAGMSLHDLMQQHRRALLGSAAERYAVFPWLIKYLDARDWLSVQVHPDDNVARRLWPDEGGKTEAWFILDAAPGSRVWAGLRPGVDERRLRAALAEGTVVECLHGFVPRPGDCIFLPAGTVHAVGGGVLFAEVQQTSDATFRLFDWNRRGAQGNLRQLHIEEAMACIDWERGPVNPLRATAFAAGGKARQLLVRCPYFTLEYVQDREPFAGGGEGCLQALMVVKGRGRLATAMSEEPLRTGQTWVFPAAMPAVTCRPEGELGVLLSTLPLAA